MAVRPSSSDLGTLPIIGLWLGVGGVGLLLALAITIMSGGDSGYYLILLALPLGALLLLGPPGVVAIIIAFAVLLPSVEVIQVGDFGLDFSLKVWDLAFVILVAWVLSAPRNRRPHLYWLGPLMLLAIAPLTLLVVRELMGATLQEGAWVSSLRFAQTLSLAWLAARAIADGHDLRIAVRSLILAGSAAMVIGIVFAGSIESAISERTTGVFELNTFGLVAGLMVLSFFWDQDRRALWQRGLPAVLGVVGLLLAKSLGALFATAVIVPLSIYLVGRLSNRRRMSTLVTGAAIAGLLIAGSILLLEGSRPESLPTGQGFQSGSSPSVRFFLGTAAFQMFQEAPLAGQGWLSSSDWSLLSVQPVMGAADAGPVKFQVLTEYLSPSAHNAYMQTLAEMGLFGGVLLLWCLARLGRLVIAALRTQDPGGVLFPAMALAFIFLWWNTSSFYGSQTESMLMALLVGVLAGVTPIPGQGRAARSGDSELRGRLG